MPSADPDCLFCRIVAREIPATVVGEDEKTLSFMDINPASDGHALVIPKAHSTDVLSIESEDLEAVIHAAQELAGRAKERLGADGVNILNSCGAAAWQSVFHTHFHVIPRYAGDSARDRLTLPWEPAPGDPDTIARAAQELIS